LYAPDGVLKQMAKKQILAKNVAMEKCLKGVKQELRQFFSDIVEETVACYFRKLAVKVENVISSQLSRCSEKCADHLKELLQEESGYLNPKQADFLISDQNSEHAIVQTGTLSFGDKQYWCVMSPKNLSMYTLPVKGNPDLSHNDCKITVDDENAHRFQLKSGTGSGYLLAQNRSEFNAWKDAFINAGYLEFKLSLNKDTV
jgi:Dynamin central region